VRADRPAPVLLAFAYEHGYSPSTLEARDLPMGEDEWDDITKAMKRGISMPLEFWERVEAAL